MINFVLFSTSELTEWFYAVYLPNFSIHLKKNAWKHKLQCKNMLPETAIWYKIILKYWPIWTIYQPISRVGGFVDIIWVWYWIISPIYYPISRCPMWKPFIRCESDIQYLECCFMKPLHAMDIRSFGEFHRNISIFYFLETWNSLLHIYSDLENPIKILWECWAKHFLFAKIDQFDSNWET